MPRHFDRYQAQAAIENYSENAADSSNRYGLPFLAMTSENIHTANLNKISNDQKLAAIQLLKSSLT
ncbi:hypothetical protein [Nonlabens agnitus]|uniref:Uncharacterized protein n=1 Tax=Nonlabens agnitus TaxID=870484 RepID=A0A2S9WXC8_9FLAO|nr:hypothetical protein [Nonlabens agnitus]PRP68132.1 hypothetical protein BST86_14055 [Nonlabens agnitus]